MHYPPAFLLHSLVDHQPKRGGNVFHFSASPQNRHASTLAIFQYNYSLTLSCILSLYNVDQHQWSFTSLHQPKNVALCSHGTELGPGIEAASAVSTAQFGSPEWDSGARRGGLVLWHSGEEQP